MKSAWQTVTGYRPAKSAGELQQCSKNKWDEDKQMQQSVTLAAAGCWTFCVGAADMDGARMDDVEAEFSMAPPPSARSCANAFVLQRQPSSAHDHVARREQGPT